MFEMQTLALIAGIVAGVLRSVMGWMESKKPFNPQLLVNTVFRAAICGALMAYTLNLDPMMTFFTVYMEDSLLNKSYKIVKNSRNSKKGDSAKHE